MQQLSTWPPNVYPQLATSVEWAKLGKTSHLKTRDICYIYTCLRMEFWPRLALFGYVDLNDPQGWPGK